MDNQVFLENFEELKKVIIQNADYDLKKNDSKLDLENLNSAISGKLILKGFGEFESELDLTTFDWINGSSDRNWWWQIQALPFLNWYIGYYDLTTAEEKTKINEFVKKSVFNWIEKSEQEIKSPLLWHDHATAFRLRHLVRWINFLVLNDLYQDYISIEEQKTLLDLVQKHVEFLNLEENYSKHTNHGFDQMLIVYTVSLLWSNVNYLNEAGELAEKRLEEELDFAFTHQGVHVENSPGYQKFMLSRIELLTELKELGDNRLSKKAFDLIERAKKFLEVITMPNGYIPMIGDTKGDDKGLQVQLSENIEFYDYSESGYYIAKGLASDGKAVHLVFKCSHMSNYHRHDDDLSFHLFYDDEVIFGDGGLGFYQEKDERRIFLRSNQAHNTVFPLGIDAIRVPNELKAKPTMKVLEPGLVVAETSMYGGRLQRVLDIRNLKDFEMIIQDRWLELPEQNSNIEFSINFFIPNENNIKYLNDKCFFITPKNNKIVLKNISDLGDNEQKTFYFFEKRYVSNKFAEFANAINFGWNILTKNDVFYKTMIDIKNNVKQEKLNISDNYENFEFITDSKNRKMYYQFTPAKKPSNAPLFVILHGHTFNAKPSKYKNEDWNILCPIDNFGVNKSGSWWLGEKGEFFVKDLLHTLIFKIRNDINSDKGLFFWGSSMGGYGALLHGILLNAKAIYVNIPQIKLLKSTYSEKSMKKFFEPIFGNDENSIFNDVTNFLNILSPQDNPLFFLVQSRFDYKNYLEEQGLYFFQKCKDNSINISLEIVPENGHKVFYTIDESVKKIEKYVDINEDDLSYIYLKKSQEKNKIINEDNNYLMYLDKEEKMAFGFDNNFCEDVGDTLKNLKKHFASKLFLQIDSIDEIKDIYFKELIQITATLIKQRESLLHFYNTRELIINEKTFYYASFSLTDGLHTYTYLKHSSDFNYDIWLTERINIINFIYINKDIGINLIESKNHLEEAISGIVKTICNTIVQKKEYKENQYSLSKINILASYPRPYHFFVDLAPCILELMNTCDTENFSLISFSNNAFFSFENTCKFLNNIEIFDVNKLNITCMKNKFVIFRPTKSILINKQLSKENYNTLRNISAKLEISNEKTNKDSFVLWIGICAEKRSWIEQEEGVLEIIKMFNDRYSSLTVILDGLTSPEGVNKEDFISTYAVNDNLFAKKIIDQFNNIVFINAVGCKAYEKIALASKVDFFVSGFLTDSMYVARFNNKYGLAYGANVANPQVHRHPNTLILPKKYITDVVGKDENWARVSYSISPEMMKEWILKKLDCTDKSRNVTQLFSGKGFSVSENIQKTGFLIKSNIDKHTYICLEEIYKGFADNTEYSYQIREDEEYWFRFEAFSELNTRLYIIAYKDNERFFTESLHSDSNKLISFPSGSTHFRLFLRLDSMDELEFFDVHWNTYSSVGSFKKGGYFE